MSNGRKKAYPCPSNATPQGMTYRQYLIAQVTPAVFAAGLNNDAWNDYDDLAITVIGIVDAVLRAECEGEES